LVRRSEKNRAYEQGEVGEDSLGGAALHAGRRPRHRLRRLEALAFSIGIDAAAAAPTSGDVSELGKFTDGCMDYVFSSHCLEDFEDTAKIAD
jgi:hypothetical protein